MKSNVEKIRAEIERMKRVVDGPILSDNDLIIGERNAYIRILSFIDSLKEETMLTASDRGTVDEIIFALETLGDEKMISYDKEIDFLKRIRKL